MSQASKTAFALKFERHPDLKPQVLQFTGTMALNSLYRFRITALAETGALSRLSPGDLFGGLATLTLQDTSGRIAGEGRRSAWAGAWHGVITSTSTGRRTGDWTVLEVTLEPTLSRLAGQIQNRVHLEAATPDIVKDSLLFGGVPASQVRFLMDKRRYPKREFVLQYGEDLLDFVFRNLEREGIALFWDQEEGADVAVFADSNAQFPQLADGGKGDFRAASHEVSGLASGELDRGAVFGLRREARVPRASVRLKDYNWENPNRKLEVSLPIATYGRGEVYLYGENFQSDAEGKRLAGLRREEELSACESWTAESSVPGLAPGYALRILGETGGDPDGLFVVTAMETSGSQAGLLSAGLGIRLGPEGEGDAPAELRHRVRLTRGGLQFRPRRVTPRNRIAGSLTAWIDGAGSGESPEMDKWGRYKVLLPLDLSGRPNGLASSWIRMAQPYTGAGYGQSFPLSPGAEVLLTFVDGDPDRPVISGAVPNAETGPVVNTSSSHLSAIGTRGGGGIVFSNKPTKQNVTLAPGTDRGHFTIAGGSPTTAAVAADVLDATAVINQSANLLHAEHSAGYRYAINASEESMEKLMMIMASINTALQVAADAADLVVARQDHMGEREKPSPGDGGESGEGGGGEA
ncbi:MAG: type VI secretion system tip protein VgrG, partial [Deltaproteobacteria bacterium]|nr:type VI secretion system tip protein VgrG [Deltaproteobacteria bacterium]